MTSRILLCCLNYIFAGCKGDFIQTKHLLLAECILHIADAQEIKVRYVYLLQLNNEIGSLDLVYIKRGRLHTLAYYKIRTGLMRDMQLCTTIYMH